MKKKIIGITCVGIGSILLSALLAFGIFSLIKNRNVAKTGNVLGVSWYNETDTVFTITTAEELYEFAELSKFYNFKGQMIKLGADIVVNEGNAADWGEDAPAKKWKPINHFSGTFDGQGHTISGLYGKVFGAKLAMFTNTVQTCTIKNLRLENTYFESNGLEGLASFVSTGGGKFYKLYSDAILKCSGEQVGGLASMIRKASKFEECWFDGSIYTTNRDAGGLIDEIAEVRVDMKHCLYSGTLVQEYTIGGTRTGAICGRVRDNGSLIMEDCLASGTVTASKTVYTGALVGVVYSGCQIATTNSYISADTYHLMVGDSGEQGIINGKPLHLMNDALVGVKAYEWTTLDFDKYWAAVEGDTPVLKCFGEQGMSLAGVEKAFDISWYQPGTYTYELTTLKQLYGFYILSGGNDFAEHTIKLGADIIVNEGNAKDWAKKAPQNPWFAINKFAGMFDGQGHTISGIYLKNQMTYQGLFAQVEPTGIVKNFSLKNSYFCNDSDGKLAMMGSIAGEFRGKLENVYSDAIVVSSGTQAGGIFGRTNDNDSDGKEDKVLITNCWFDGELRMKGQGGRYGGGLVGMVVQGDLDIVHCLNTGNCSAEAVNTGVHLGGFIGSTMNKGVINMSDCLNAGEVKSEYKICVGSVFGRSTNEERTVNLNSVYATKESNDVTFFGTAEGGSTTAVVNGGVIPLAEEMLTGYLAYQWTDLDFAKHWAIVKNDTPVLRQFAKSVPSVAGTKKMVDFSWYKANKKTYEIKTANQLRGLAVLSNTDDFKGKTVKLAANIDLGKQTWLPIGSSAMNFRGVFDGQGHTISGVSLDIKEYYGGLFGIAGEGAVVKNFRLTDSDFTYSGTEAAILGSVVGDLYGGATLENVYSSATVVSHGSQAGGMVGRINDNDKDQKNDKAIIRNCWFDGTFSMKGDKTQYGGGLVGRIFRGDLDMSNCLNSGSISSEAVDTALQLGGLIGAVNDVGTLNLSDSLSTGIVTTQTGNGVGSIIGRTSCNNDGERIINIEDTYATTTSYKAVLGSVSKSKMNGGFIPLPEDMLTGYSAYQWTELDFAKYWAVAEGDTPVLQKFASNVPSLDGYEKLYDLAWYKAGKYEIKNAKELRGLALISGADNFVGKTIKLTADVDLNEENWISIGSSLKPFAGTFDGNMNTISGVKVNTSTAVAGLFGEIGSAGKVSNFYLTDSTFTSTATDLGSVAGINRGTISAVYSDATIASSQLRSGGIVGSMLGEASVDHCWFDGTMTLTSANGKQSGGIVGYIGQNTANTNVSITDCLYTGDLTFEATSTKWGLRIGGIAGGAHDYYTPTITIENCISAGTVKQKDNSANIYAVSAVYGGFDEPRATTLNLKNVYGTNECCSVARIYHQYKANADADGTDPIITGTGTLLDEVALQGTSGYQLTNLDFANTWAARSKEVPALQKFVETSLSLAGVVKADTSWYQKGETIQRISDEEDMLGFMKLMAEGNTFEGKKIYLEADLELNKVEADTIGKWADGTVTPSNKWIGGTKFAGTFDGGMHMISGIYLNTSGAAGGLFGEVTATGIVKNLYIKDSLFKSTTTDLGSVAGINRGTISTVYSNATIVSSQLHSGGIVGSMLNSASVDHCWFDGDMTLTGANGKQSGGIVGYIAQGTANTNVSITDCLYTGDLTFEATSTKWGLRIGGIAGGAHDYYTPTITIENCISAGTVKQKANSANIYAVSAVYGGFDEPRATKLTLENVYATNECCSVARIYHQYKADANAAGTGPIITGTGALFDASALQGVSGYQNTELDFVDTWAARSNEVPALKVFTEFASSWLDVTSVVKPDTSWYKANETRQEILDEADMYGFMKLMVEGNTFAGKKVYLMADLNAMNKVEAGTIDKWAAGTETPDNKWVGGTKFAGTFDGQMHTISGIYLNTTAAGGGLFGEITATGVVKNLYIKDSLFKSTAGKVGSVAGISYGTISTVYSDADVVSNQLMTGGIVGNMKDTASVDTCWYAGDMKLSTKNGKQAGGIVGYIDRGAANINVSIMDCLYTGNITFEAADATWALRIGGIVGGAHDYRTPTINLENCVSAGTITQSPSSANHLGVSAVYGGLDGSQVTALNFVNVYAIKGCFVEERIYDKKVDGPKVTGTGLFKAKTDLQGVKGYQNTLLDFEDTWVARKDNVPAPKAFTKVVGETVSITGVEQNNWYNASETVFGIGSASALKSLATYTNASSPIDFKDKTIYLTDDIEVNEVKDGTLAAWSADTAPLPTSWTPIGIGAAFNGTFDGRMHTISGIYLNATSTNTSRWTGFGMFARTAYNSTVRNFSLVDSYFAVDKNGGNANGSGYISNLGSIVGYHHGYLNNVYSNATIASNRRQVGGIMGYSNSRGVSNVWFDGTISVSSAHGREVGGIIGVMDSNNTFENILFTGEITHNADRVDMGIGGIIGITYSTSTCTPTLKNVVAAGKITKGKWGGDQAVGSVVGLLYKATVKVENLYVTNETWSATTHNIASGGTGTISGTITKVTEANLYGDLAKTNAAALDYTNTWVTRTGKVPALKKFVK